MGGGLQKGPAQNDPQLRKSHKTARLPQGEVAAAGGCGWGWPGGWLLAASWLPCPYLVHVCPGGAAQRVWAVVGHHQDVLLLEAELQSNGGAAVVGWVGGVASPWGGVWAGCQVWVWGSRLESWRATRLHHRGLGGKSKRGVALAKASDPLHSPSARLPLPNPPSPPPRLACLGLQQVLHALGVVDAATKLRRGAAAEHEGRKSEAGDDRQGGALGPSTASPAMLNVPARPAAAPQLADMHGGPGWAHK